jgi:integrase
MKVAILIERYIKEKTLAWSPATLQSEERRLKALSKALNGNPKRLWKELEIRGIAPYTRVTTWTRVVDFWNWMLANGHKRGPNKYLLFRQNNKRAFQNAYVRSTPELGYDEAKRLIEGLREEDIRSQALALLDGGLRFKESLSIQNGTVEGKGGKRRTVFVDDQAFNRSRYSTLLRRLRALGLKPHTLRKIMATELARKGLHEADLCEFFGWASFDTAKSYIAPIEQERLKAAVKLIRGDNDRLDENTTKQVS